MRTIISFLATVFILGAAGPPHAQGGFDVIAGDFVTFGDAPGSPGGIFHIDVSNPLTSDFDTFCVELTEHVGIGKTYNVESIGLWTKDGGKKLGAQAAWLYTQFLDQNITALVDFDFGLIGLPTAPAPAKKQADALQLGIWRGMVDVNDIPDPYLDANITYLSGWSQEYIDSLTNDYLQDWLDVFDDDDSWSGTGSIQIMNLRGYKYVGPENKLVLTTYAQDQLVRMDSLEVFATPELPTVYSAGSLVSCAVLWGIIALVRKRRREGLLA